MKDANLLIDEVDRSLTSLRGLWMDPEYVEKRKGIMTSIDSALDTRLQFMAHRDRSKDE